MIDRLILKNFKVLRDIDVALRPLTLVVGPNASGKTSLLEALSLLFESIYSPPLESNTKGLRSYSGSGSTVLECSGSFAGPELKLSLKVGEDGRPQVDGWWGDKNFGIHRKPVPFFVMETLAELRRLRVSSLCLELDFTKLAAPSYLKQISQSLPNDGEGLSAFLANLSIESPQAFRLLVDRLRSVVSAVRDIRLRPVYVQDSEPGEGRVGYELIFDMHGAEGIPAHAISEGTLLTLGLLTVLSSPDPPRLILIDDLERGLHPKALGDLVKQIRALQVQDSELQIVATSHSPYLLDYLEAEEILLTSLDEEGYASVRPLSDHPEYERWKDVMAPGEFWSTVGEKWVTDKVNS